MSREYSAEVTDVIMTVTNAVKAREEAGKALPVNGELAKFAHILSIDIGLMKILNYGLMLEMDPDTRADFDRWMAWTESDCTAVTEKLNLLEWQEMQQDAMLEAARSTMH
jgi:hypothetical protein